MAGVSGIGNQSIFAASGMDLDAMGLEEMIMYVQQKRAESCQTLLEGQVKAVQGRTNEINRLNGIMSKLNEASAAMAGKAAGDNVALKPEAVLKINEAAKMGPETVNAGYSLSEKKIIYDRLYEQAKREIISSPELKGTDPTTHMQAEYNKTLADAVSSGVTHSVPTTDPTVAILVAGTKSKLDTAITNLKTQIDSLNNNQQTDMLRLQGLTTKYNECFDTMSNVMKKFDGSRSGIVGNLR